MTGPREPGSILLVREYFAQQDPRFLAEVRRIIEPPALAAFADQWKQDPRPWSRQQFRAYLESPLNCPGHNPLVKRWFKHVEKLRDLEFLPLFLVAFDRAVRRKQVQKWVWNRDTRRLDNRHVLRAPAKSLTRNSVSEYKDWRSGQKRYYVYATPEHRLFSLTTRGYLRRRVWRYFRRLGYQQPQSYVAAVVPALMLYTDADLATGPNLLDNYGLMQICYREAPELRFGRRYVDVRPKFRLQDLQPAPRFRPLWQAPQAFPELLKLATQAQARLIRLWAMELLRQEHRERLIRLTPEQLLELLGSTDEDVQLFASDLLASALGLEKLSVEMWLRLLETQNWTALESICQVVSRHVTPERLTLAQTLRLAGHPAAAVCRLGWGFLQARRWQNSADRRALAALAQARCTALGRDVARWALDIVGTDEHYDRDLVLPFFDSLNGEIREAAWLWLNADSERTAAQDPGLWSRLLETPYENLRLRLIDTLALRSRLPGTGAQDLAPVWASVLLAVHRGGRQKLKAIRQLGHALQQDPSQAPRLLPVLAVAVRSIRGPERRAGLAALVSAVESAPDWVASLEQLLPELRLTASEVR